MQDGESLMQGQTACLITPLEISNTTVSREAVDRFVKNVGDVWMSLTSIQIKVHHGVEGTCSQHKAYPHL